MNNIYLSIPLSVIIVAIIIMSNNIIIRNIALKKCKNKVNFCKNNKNDISLELHERQFFILNSICLGIIFLLPFIKNKTFNITFFISFAILMLFNFYIAWSNVEDKKILFTLLCYLVIFLILIGLNEYGIKKISDIKLFNF